MNGPISMSSTSLESSKSWFYTLCCAHLWNCTFLEPHASEEKQLSATFIRLRRFLICLILHIFACAVKLMLHFMWHFTLSSTCFPPTLWLIIIAFKCCLSFVRGTLWTCSYGTISDWWANKIKLDLNFLKSISRDRNSNVLSNWPTSVVHPFSMHSPDLS